MTRLIHCENEGWNRKRADEMKIIENIGNDRVYDELRASLAAPASLDLASPVCTPG